MTLIPYLQQLETAAAEAGVDLAAACEKEGIAATTLQRWRKGKVSPRQGTADAVMRRIWSMAPDPRTEAAA